jgi:RNA polymerase sigma-70 factor, ECF subfamily
VLQLSQTTRASGEKDPGLTLHTTAAQAGPGGASHAEFEQQLIPLLDSAYGIALHMTRDRSTAEDLVQDAVLHAFRGFATFEQGTNFKAWFLRILTNAFYSKYRREKHERGNVSMDDAAPLYLYSRTREVGLHANDADPAELLMDRIDRECVAEALDALPTEYRVVASLYFMEDMSYCQIADVVGCPVGTVRSRLHRSRRMLQQSLWRVAQERGIVQGMMERNTA